MSLSLFPLNQQSHTYYKVFNGWIIPEVFRCEKNINHLESTFQALYYITLII